MRTVLPLLAAALLAAAASASAADGWLPDLDEGFDQARRTGKHLLVDFTGSDWCPPCQALDRDLLSKADFRRDAGAEFVLVSLDFPRRKAQAADLRARNRAYAEQYGVRGYPTLIAMTPDGTEYGRRVGYTSGRAGDYRAWIERLGDHRDAIEDALDVLGRPSPDGGAALDAWRQGQVDAAASLVETLGTDAPASAVTVLELHDPQDTSLAQARLALLGFEARSVQDGEPDFERMARRLDNLPDATPSIVRLGDYHAWRALAAAMTERDADAADALEQARRLGASDDLLGYVESVAAR